MFAEFWAIGDYDLQNSYIQKIVCKMEVKRWHRPTDLAAHAPAHTCNLQYAVCYQNTVYSVCKLGFLSMFGLKRRRVENAVRKVSATLTPQCDRRGKHAPSTKIVGVQLEHVKEHIRSVPTVSSHYTRAKPPHRKYMNTSLSINRLYAMYLQWMTAEHPEEPMVKTGL